MKKRATGSVVLYSYDITPFHSPQALRHYHRDGVCVLIIDHSLLLRAFLPLLNNSVVYYTASLPSCTGIPTPHTALPGERRKRERRRAAYYLTIQTYYLLWFITGYTVKRPSVRISSCLWFCHHLCPSPSALCLVASPAYARALCHSTAPSHAWWTRLRLCLTRGMTPLHFKISHSSCSAVRLHYYIAMRSASGAILDWFQHAALYACLLPRGGGVPAYSQGSCTALDASAFTTVHCMVARAKLFCTSRTSGRIAVSVQLREKQHRRFYLLQAFNAIAALL